MHWLSFYPEILTGIVNMWGAGQENSEAWALRFTRRIIDESS